MTDYEKIQELIKKERFDSIQNDEYELAKLIINKTIKNFEKASKDYGRAVHLNAFDFTYKNQTEAYVYYETITKKQSKDMINIFKSYFGNKKSNLFTYIHKIVIHASEPHYKLSKETVPFHSKCRDLISNLADVPVHILKQTTKTEFDALLKEHNESEIIKTYKRKELSHPVVIKETFDSYNLKDLLEFYNDDPNYVGLKQLAKYKTLPRFIDDSALNNNILKKHIFIEGYHGTGKTTLAHQIAYNIDIENSYYIQFEDDYNKILNKNDKESIIAFLKMLKKNNGVVILDNINLNTSSKNTAKFYFNEANEIGLKLIFIATLEQYNNLQDIKTFRDSFYDSDFKRTCSGNLHIELSSSKDSLKQKLQVLDSFLINYLSFINQENLLPKEPDDRDKLLTTLNETFKGILYLLKLAIDDNNYISLSSLKYDEAISVIENNYQELIDNLDDETIHNLLFITKNNIYLRIKKEEYNYGFSQKFEFIKKLIEEKKLYKLEDNHFNKNIAIFFPNTIIPSEIYKIVKNRFGVNEEDHFIFDSYIESFLKLSINNISNILRHLINVKEDPDILLDICMHLTDPKFYNTELKESISLHDIINIMKINTDYTLNNDRPLRAFEDSMIMMFDNIIKGTDYFTLLLSNYKEETIQQILNTLKNFILSYHKLQKKLTIHTNIKQKKLKTSKHVIGDRLKVVNNHMKIFEDFLELILQTLKKEHFESYFISENFYLQLNSIFNTLRFEWYQNQYQRSFEKIYNRVQNSI